MIRGGVEGGECVSQNFTRVLLKGRIDPVLALLGVVLEKVEMISSEVAMGPVREQIAFDVWLANHWDGGARHSIQPRTRIGWK
jgi:hypothetical protein